MRLNVKQTEVQKGKSRGKKGKRQLHKHCLLDKRLSGTVCWESSRTLTAQPGEGANLRDCGQPLLVG